MPITLEASIITSTANLNYSNGTYVGDVLDGVRSGMGTFTWNDRDVYEGDWLDGTPTGATPYREGNAVIDVDPHSDENVNAVLYEDSNRWVSNSDYSSGDRIVITFSFIGTNSNLFDEGYDTPNPLSDSIIAFDTIHKAATINTLSMFESFINVEFQQRLVP